MKRALGLFVLLILFTAVNDAMLTSAPATVTSKITAVKLYTNRAEITRISKIRLVKGSNTIIIEGLPDNMIDWSARGMLPEKYNGRIISLEIMRQALIEKKKNRIHEIEKKLEDLRDRDAELADDMTNIRQQEIFLDSIVEFTKNTASKELETRIPQTGLWSGTMDYVSSKRKELLAASRALQKKRRGLAEEIQKLEFELSQLAGTSYYSSYKKLNKAVEQNTKSNTVQQYGDFTDSYEEMDRTMKDESSGVDTEKRIMLNIYSAVEGETEFTFSYLIPDTYWQMTYDFRASRTDNSIEVILYADVFQKTGEDWENIDLSLSTGAPQNNIAIPDLAPWYLNKREEYKSKRDYESASGMYDKKAMKEEAYAADEDNQAVIPEATVQTKGLFLEVKIPVRQTIESANRYQKKLIKSYSFKSGKGLKYYFKTVPDSSGKVYLMAKTANQTELPWLGGEAQVFLENEFIGRVQIPDTSVGKEEDLVLGISQEITAKKELVKKYEDKSGVFGGKKRMVYSYKITLENNSKETAEVLILDNFPVSQNDDIKVEIEKLSAQYQEDEIIKKTTEYQQGIRKFTVTLSPGSKREITYDAVITFDKELEVDGLR
ncbi:MAG TPA: mucoidy inhibitor MuiA family protein [Spirochaetota bacterium]|nr:mucoidy inhibitor MuiA family protein [Spirochaetota bacterium]